MSTISPEEMNFILELHNMIGPDVNAQVSMYDVGSSLGMDKNATSGMSQDLMIEELLELKTLAGGIGITDKGLELLRKRGLITGTATTPVIQLSQGPVPNEQDLQEINRILKEIKSKAFTTLSSFPQIEELVIDVKTLETQLLSPRPKTAIVKSVFQSLFQLLANCGAKESADTIQKFIE